MVVCWNFGASMTCTVLCGETVWVPCVHTVPSVCSVARVRNVGRWHEMRNSPERSRGCWTQRPEHVQDCRWTQHVPPERWYFTRRHDPEDRHRLKYSCLMQNVGGFEGDLAVVTVNWHLPSALWRIINVSVNVISTIKNTGILETDLLFTFPVLLDEAIAGVNKWQVSAVCFTYS
jgi:hypothetical protein